MQNTSDQFTEDVAGHLGMYYYTVGWNLRNRCCGARLSIIRRTVTSGMNFPILSSSQYAICTWYYSLSGNFKDFGSSDSHLIWPWAIDQGDFTDYYRKQRQKFGGANATVGWRKEAMKEWGTWKLILGYLNLSVGSRWE